MLAGDAWIADGNYRETLDLRLERADTLMSSLALVALFRTSPPGGASACRTRAQGATTRPGPGSAMSGSGRPHRPGRRSEPACERVVDPEHGQHVAVYVLRSTRVVSELLERLHADRAAVDDG